MPLSVSSYLLGVGTVVGALTLGFGGGVLLTHTAMKPGPSGLTRVEQVARSEPKPAAVPQAADVAVSGARENAPPLIVSARESAEPPAAQVPAVTPDPAQIAQAPAAQPAATPAVQAEPPKPQTLQDAEREKQALPAQSAEPARRLDQARQIEQARPAEQARQTEPREVEQRKTADRKQRYAERKPREIREMTVVRMKPRRLEVVDEPEPEVVSEPQERHFDLFKMPGLFSRPDDRDE
jgi:hypothetical protein